MTREEEGGEEAHSLYWTALCAVGRRMPPFEGVDPTNLRQTSSLYDNLLDEVQTYSTGLKERFHISFHSYQQQDVVATRDIIVGKHPLYEPGTPEWDEYVVGQHSSVSPESSENKPTREHPSSTTATATATTKEEPKKRQRTLPKGPPQSCANASDVMEWVEIFTGLCMAPKHEPTECVVNLAAVDKGEPPEELVEEKEEEVPRREFQPDIAALKNRVLYPIAKYPSRLDSQRLIEQRRRFIESRVNFKPLRLEKRKVRKTPKKY